MPIDKELLKEVVNCKKPRNFAFVEGSEDKLLLVSKSTVANDDIETAKKKSKGKLSAKGKIQLESNGNGQTVVFFMAKPDQSYAPKFRRALKEHCGLSKAVEVRDLADMKPTADAGDGNAGDANVGNAGDGNVAQQDQPKVQRGPLEKEYGGLRRGLKEEVEALKTLNPKAAPVVQAKLSAAEQALGQQSAGDARFKPGIKLLKSLKSTVAKLPRKGTDATKAVSDRAAYKSLRDRLTPLALKLGKVDQPTASAVARMIVQADQYIADTLPEERRDYKKGMKELLAAKKTLLAGFKAADQNNLTTKNVPEKDQALVKFKTSLRKAKEMTQAFGNAAPQAPELQQWAQKMAAAGELARTFQFDAALKDVDGLIKEISGFQLKHEQANHALDITRSVIAEARKATQPRIPDPLLKTFSDYLGGAESLMRKNRIDDAIAGARELDDRVRKAIGERKMFCDSAQAVESHFAKAYGVVDDTQVEQLVRRHVASFFDFESGDMEKAYDEITKVEAEFQRALRMVPPKNDAPKSGGVDGSSQSTEIQEGTSDRARELKFKLNVEGVKRSFGLLKAKSPNDLAEFENWLGIVLKKKESNFDAAEDELAALVDDLNQTVELIRLVMPVKTSYPMRRPNRSAPPMPRDSLDKWKNKIDPSKLSFDPEKQLGAGGQGAIYQLASTDPNTPPLVVKFADMKEDNASEEMKLEAKNYELVGDHPNIIRSLGITNVGGKEGLVLEQVKGTGFDNVTGNLKARLAKGEITQTEFWSSVQYTLGKTLEVLDFIHEKGLAHNDIKPENIMLDKTTGDVKVIDLGTVNPLTQDPGETSPVYRAPEAGKGSSQQTDVFSTGASAFEAGEGETFSYAQKEAMAKAGRRIEIEKIVQQYGDLKDDDQAGEMAIKQQNQINPTEQTVDEKGTPDPTGANLKKNAGVSAGKSAYTEFVNWLLHPDPTKRPTAKEAMRHPFIRDRILDDEKVRELLKNTMSDTPPEQAGKEPMRKRVATGDGAKHSTSQDLRLATAKLDELKASGVDAMSQPDLMEMRVEIDRYMNSAKSAKRNVGAGIRALEDIVKKAVVRNSPEFYKDQAKLIDFEKFVGDWDKLEKPLRRALRKVNVALSTHAKSPNDEPVDQEITAEQARERLEKLTSQRTIIAKDFNTIASNTSAPSFERIQDLQGVVKQVEAAQARNEREKKLLVKLLKRVKSNESVAVGREFQAHLTALEKLSDDVDEAIRQVELQINDVEWDVIDIEYETMKVEERLGEIREEAKKKGLAFETEAKKPRNTQQDIEAFEKARAEFEKAQQEQREAEVALRGKAEGWIKRAGELAQKLGPKAPQGQTDMPGQLAAFENRLREALVGLAK